VLGGHAPRPDSVRSLPLRRPRNPAGGGPFRGERRRRGRSQPMAVSGN
jgi:hypothetical protein